VTLHLHWYTNQRHQRRIVRILLMCPIYAASSALSLKLHRSAAQYIDVVRDAYEAFVLFNFYHLILAFIHVPDSDTSTSPAVSPVVVSDPDSPADGRPRADSRPAAARIRGKEAGRNLMTKIREVYGEEPTIKHPPPLCCLEPYKVTRRSFHWFNLWVLQFIILKPLLSIIVIVGSIPVHHHNNDTQHDNHTETLFYDEEAGIFDYSNAYPYVLIVENISVTIAFTTIFYLYILVKPVIPECCPKTCPGHTLTYKFIAIKIVIFLSFWQGMAITFMVKMGWIHASASGEWTEPQVARGVQDFLVAVEMSVMSFVHHSAFSYEPYRTMYTEGKPRWDSKCRALKDIFYDQSSGGKGLFGQIWAYFEDIDGGSEDDDEKDAGKVTVGDEGGATIKEDTKEAAEGPSGQKKGFEVTARADLDRHDSSESMPTKRAAGTSVEDSGIQVAT